MRILMLTSRLPFPPDRGDRSRVFHIMETLAKKHEIYLVSFIANDEEKKNACNFENICRNVEMIKMSPVRSAMQAMRFVFDPNPLQSLYYTSDEMKKRVRSMMREYNIDAVYVHLFRMAQFVDGHSDDVYKILDMTDAISSEIDMSMKYRKRLSKLIYSIEGPRIKKCEKTVVGKFDETWMITDHDLCEIRKMTREGSMYVVPIGVDTNVLCPMKGPGKEDKERKNNIIFVGHMKVFHNVDAVLYFYNEIFPKIRSAAPDSRFMIVGQDPHKKIQQLAADPNVIVTGFVDDLCGTLNEAKVFVAPLRFAAGLQTKVLEAMSAGVPVVTSSMVNRGLKAEDGKEIMIADNPDDFARVTIDLLGNAEKREKQAVAAREFVEKNFSWDIALERTLAIESGLLKK